MLTATFQLNNLGGRKNSTDHIEKLVKTKLASKYFFIFSRYKCYLVDKQTNLFAICDTPDKLVQYAWCWDNLTTFSVTLPAKYWK